jgi:hypothetical protein
MRTKKLRREFMAWSALGSILLFPSTSALAQTPFYPGKTITVIQ